MSILTHFAAAIGMFLSLSFFGTHTTKPATTTPVAQESASTTPATPVLQMLNKVKQAAVSTVHSSIPVPASASASVTATNSNAVNSVSPLQSPPQGTATIDAVLGDPTVRDDYVAAAYISTPITGTAANESSLDVVLIPDSVSATDWNTVSTNGQSHLYTADVINGKWEADAIQLPQGTYNINAYDPKSHALLASSDVKVTAPEGTGFLLNGKQPTILGLGQDANDARLRVTLESISGGTATLRVDSINLKDNMVFKASAGDYLPKKGTGFPESMNLEYDVTVQVVSISATNKTVTLLFLQAPKAQDDPTYGLTL